MVAQFFPLFLGIYADSVVKAIIRSYLFIDTSHMDFKKQFQDIATTSHPAATLLRKAVVSGKKDKMLFSPKQLTKVVTLQMNNLLYILFRPKSEIKDTVLLLFLAANQDDSNWRLQKI